MFEQGKRFLTWNPAIGFSWGSDFCHGILLLAFLMKSDFLMKNDRGII
jgi:hypothetical protein